ncbi:MAG: AAA family ATPase [bacterium]
MAANRYCLKKLGIQNFKFFKKLKEIELDGKNLLLYGENGSGKSSIYWALYTFFECSHKAKDEDIIKYFDPDDGNHLTNIHLKADVTNTFESYINLEMVKGDTNLNLKLSKSDLIIKNNNIMKESIYATDFINYRLLFRLNDFYHSEDIDLFPLFRKEFLPYQQLVVKPSNYSGDMSLSKVYENILIGPKYQSINANKIYPKQHEPEYLEYLTLQSVFEKSLLEIVDNINTKGVPILRNDFGYDFKYNLDFHVSEFSIINNQFIPPKYYIDLNVSDYESIGGQIQKPQSFLNEAKLAALALSMRFAILEQRLMEGDILKLLVLDDLLISLDMSNRQKVLKLIFEKYQKNYQCIIMTHDKLFFDLAKRKIEESKYTNWLYKEMYFDYEKKEPIILETEKNYTLAQYYFSHFDYPACANNLRKFAEDIFVNIFPMNIRYTEKGEEITKLNNYIERAIKFYNKNNLNSDLLLNLKDKLFLLLNPLSHFSEDINIYSSELLDTLKILPALLTEIEGYNIKEFIQSNDIIEIKFKVNSTVTNIYEIKPREKIYIFTQGTTSFLSPNSFDSMRCYEYDSSKNTTVMHNFEVHKNKNLFKMYKEIYKYNYDEASQPGATPIDENSIVVELNNIFRQRHGKKDSFYQLNNNINTTN